jgi:hypothetical protein
MDLNLVEMVYQLALQTNTKNKLKIVSLYVNSLVIKISFRKKLKF